MVTSRVGRRIKAFRKLKGYTQVGLAKDIHVSIAELRCLERGDKEAPAVVLDQIATTLAVSKEELIGKSENLKKT
ncbi:helix-turn-helix domain-containing protein [Virgibacillus necropolis]|uniref:Transcriptional regulator n=1 Tax=Virgibacillus necropolis TaxID=163877 RepID=A0A221M7T7_9BACI|nr:helix-turn-helix transcriptional regulator [Virgibacillus necropolis]ASN03713.1 transcriptional regulator [Virgibacillus necropolis]